MVKMAVIKASKWPKLISREIWVAENSWNFHTVNFSETYQLEFHLKYCQLRYEHSKFQKQVLFCLFQTNLQPQWPLLANLWFEKHHQIPVLDITIWINPYSSSNSKFLGFPHCVTVWKFQDFCSIQFLREINFREAKSCKTAIFAILGALIFCWIGEF